MSRSIVGEDVHQFTLLPECLIDFIAEGSMGRSVDALVSGLNMKVLGFDGANPAAPDVRPTILPSGGRANLGGCYNRIQSRRHLKREASPRGNSYGSQANVRLQVQDSVCPPPKLSRLHRRQHPCIELA